MRTNRFTAGNAEEGAEGADDCLNHSNPELPAPSAPSSAFPAVHLFVLCLALLSAACAHRPTAVPDPAFERAARNGEAANEALLRSHRLMLDWLEQADSATGLLPRNLQADRDIWNARDAAADLYPFLTLTAWFTDRDLFAGRMHDILLTETALTSRVGRLADTYSFSRRDFASEEIDLFRIVHGEQKFSYVRPVVPGDVLTATLTVASLRQISGADIIGTTSEITDAAGAVVCSTSATLVHKGADA